MISLQEKCARVPFAHACSQIEIFGTDFKPRLLELIDADQLPVEYGGTCTCEGGCVPKPQFEEKAVVPARDKVERRIACAEAGGELAWFFSTVGNDVKFSVEFQPSADGAAKVEVVGLGKCNSHHFPVSGVHTSNAPGEWIVTWGAQFRVFI